MYSSAQKKGFEETFHKFCNSISLHGYGYLSSANNFVLKIFWLISIVALTCIAAVLFIKNTENYFKSGIITTIETSTASLDVSTAMQMNLQLLVHSKDTLFELSVTFL